MMKNYGLLSRLGAAFARIREILNAGPGNTCGEPVGIAGHLVFAPVPAHRTATSELNRRQNGQEIIKN
jgi:hypothetical protein